MATIVSTEDVLDGKPRLDGRRIAVSTVAGMVLNEDHSPEYVADQLDVTLAEVHTALAYYYEHAAEMREERARRTALESELESEFVEPPERVAR